MIDRADIAKRAGLDRRKSGPIPTKGVMGLAMGSGPFDPHFRALANHENSMNAGSDVSQHNTEIQQNMLHWQRKPLLRAAYAEFYRLIAERLSGAPEGPVVECGSGIGNLKSVLPACITTDLFPNPWIDRVENVYALSFADDSVAAFILFDVFHHLEYPGRGLAELHRCLKPGGRLIIFEPAMGLLGRIALGLFHHEPLGLGQPISWTPPPSWNPNEMRYYAAQGNAWRIFRAGEHRSDLASWSIAGTKYSSGLLWLLCGGFRGPQLCPTYAAAAIRWLDRLTSRAAGVFATRMLIVLEKPLH